VSAPSPITGPELDLYLTKEVLGCHWSEFGHYAQVADGAETGWYTPEHKYIGSRFEPSRCFPNAWLMATILIQRGHTMMLISPSPTCETWTARFTKDENTEGPVAIQPSAEMAICVAALGLKT
jgi:hypothetical protein